MFKLLKSPKSKTSLNESKDISNGQISHSESLVSENESIIEEYSEIDGSGAKINVEYNQKRVDKFKAVILKDFVYLLNQSNCSIQNGDNSLSLSYVENVFNNEMHKNSNSFHTNDAEQYQKFDISTEEITNGNENFTEQNENITSCTTSSSIIENIEACAALIQILFKYEFENSKQEELDSNAKKMLQMYTKFRLNDEELLVSYAKWIAYTELCQIHSFNPEIFLKLLEILISRSKDSSKKKKNFKQKILKIPFKSKFLSKKSQGPIIFVLDFPQHFENEEDLTNIFWESTRKLLDCFLNYFHDLHCENEDDSSRPEKLMKIIETIRKIQTLNVMDEKTFQQCAKDSLTHGALEQFTSKVNISILNDSSNNIQRLDELIKILAWTKNHIINFDKKFGPIFESFFKSSFPQLLYPTYDEQLEKLIQPVIKQISEMSKDKFKSFNKDDENVLIKVFELYREIKFFLEVVVKDFKIQDPKLKNFVEWFISGIDSWRKASMMTVLFRIEKSIEVDKLKPEFNSAKYSSSVIDTMQILYSTKNFWENLQWFDKHKDADLVKEITLDLCHATSSYLEKFIEKVQSNYGNVEDDIHKISEKLSLIAANYNYELEKFRSLLDEFIKNKNTDKLEIEDSYQKTEEALNDRICQLITLELRPVNVKIEKILTGDAKASKLLENKTYDSLLTYVDDVVRTLHNDLPKKEFDIAKTGLFLEILNNITKLTKKASKKKKSVEYFITLHQNFEILKDIFNYSADTKLETANEKILIKKLEQTDNLLKSYDFTTTQLIHRYYIQRYKMQQNSQETSTKSFGVLTVCCVFNENVLKIDILNAKNLIGGMINRKCDSYVKVFVIPEKSFSNCQDFKTKNHQNNNCPSYDETIEFTLTDEQRNMKDAIIYFNVKEKHLIGGNGCIAEAFLSFEDIPKHDQNDNLPQIDLKLTRLQNDELEILKVIQYKSQKSDKEAKEFLAKINKLPVSP